MKQEITVYGSGYVGLVVAAAFADSGLSVCCVDNNPQRLQQLRELEPETEGSELSEVVRRSVAAGTLRFTGKAEDALAPVVFICVGTPASACGEADLSAVWQVAETVAKSAQENTTVFVKSTVPPGTCVQLQARMRSLLSERGESALQLEVVSNPEFLREGTAMEDFRQPDRVMIGTDSEHARQVAQTLYERIPGCCHRLIFSRAASAELAKYASNAFLAARVAMINDFALIADQCGADIDEVRQCVGSDKRIGSSFLMPGCGFGGSCFGKDLQALDFVSGDYLQSGLFRSILRGNEQHQSYPVALAHNYFDGSLEGRHVALWGLSFKPSTPDMRDSPALVIAAELAAAGAEISAYDPGLPAGTSVPKPIALKEDALSAADGADLLIVCTAWQDFRQIQPQDLHARMRRALVIDSRNLLDGQAYAACGFEYCGLGRQLA